MPPIIAEVDLIRFFGRMHFLFVHLPIGLISAWFLIEVFGRHKDHTDSKVLPIIVWGAAFAALLSVSAGFVLSTREPGYLPEMVSRHRSMALTLTGICLAGAFSVSFKYKRAKAVRRTALAAAMVAMFITGHLGGTITHGQSALSEFAPDVLKPILGGATVVAAPEGSDFAEKVYPILERYCAECHGQGERSGGFNMDTLEAVQLRVQPGDPYRSEIIRMLELPLESDHHMPPDGFDQPSAEEILEIKAWIAGGAD
jgi:uncharacterized membrane protein